MNKKNLLYLIFSGYWQKGRSLFTFLIFFLTAGILSTLIVYPLWLFATKKPIAYTIFCSVLFGAGVLWVVIRKLLQNKNDDTLPEYRNGQKKRRRLFWISVGKTLLALICLYILFIQFSSGAMVTGIILFVLFFFFLGWLFFGGTYGRKKTGSN